MKTQLIVTITQTGKNKLAASMLERDLRTIVKDIWETPDSAVTVRHVVEDTPAGSKVAANSAKPSIPPETAPQVAINRNADLEVLLSDAHRAGQLTGRLLGKEGRERANEYAAQMVATLAHT